MKKNKNEINTSLENQLKVLLEVSESIVGHINLDEVLGVILNKLVKQLGYTFSGLFLLEETNNKRLLKIKKIAVSGLARKVFDASLGGMLNVQVDLNHPDANKCLTATPVISDKISFSNKVIDFTWPGDISEFQGRVIQKVTGIKFVVGIPISLNQVPLGSLVVASTNKDLGERDKKVLQTFANQISIAIYNAQLFSKVQEQVTVLEEQAKDLNSLYDLSVLAGSSLERNTILQSLIDNIPQKLGHLGVVAGGILLKREDLDHLEVAAMTKADFVNKILKAFKKDVNDITPEQSVEESPVLSQIIKTGKIQATGTITDIFPSYVKKRDNKIMEKLAGIKSYAVAPIVSEKEVLGFAMYSFNMDAGGIETRQREILQVFTNHIATTLTNVKLFEELEKQYVKVEKQKKALTVANIKLRELDKSKSEFISIASHQLRTPLTVIKGYISIILGGDMGDIPKPVEQQLEKVSSSTDRLVTLVNDLLDVSRIERGKMVFEKSMVSLDKMVKEVFDEMKIQADKKGLKLTLDLPKKVTKKTNADIRKLHEVMINMVDNAIKYTDSGSVHMKFYQEDGNVIYEVSDTGMGFSEETKYKLFQKFSRSDESSTKHTEGLGLGLFVAKKIVEAHDGEIFADSKGEGKGATFGFRIPIAKKK